MVSDCFKKCSTSLAIRKIIKTKHLLNSLALPSQKWLLVNKKGRGRRENMEEEEPLSAAGRTINCVATVEISVDSHGGVLRRQRHMDLS